MTDKPKYPTPEDVKAFDEMVANHPVLKTAAYVERYKADPTDETINGIMSDIVLEIPVLRKQRGESKTVFFGILNELDDKWRSFVRHCGNDKVSIHAFKAVMHQNMQAAYFEWISYRKLTLRRK